MTLLFHVKLAGAVRSRMSPLIALSGCAMLLAAQSAWADVHKCTSPDGRVIFSDLPCTIGQVGGKTPFGAVTPRVAPPPPAAKDASALGRDAMRARMRAALTPECRALSERLGGYMEQGTGQTPEAVVAADMARYEQLCASQAIDAMQAETDRTKAERKVLEAQQACQEKRRVINVRRAQPASLSRPDEQALNQLEREVARDCH